jgi:hypothetical protein
MGKRCGTGWCRLLSAPATFLAKTPDLQGIKHLYKQRVKMLVIADTGDTPQDAPAPRRILADWPSPIVHVNRDPGEALPYPAFSIEKDFTWAPKHPFTAACRAFQPMPCDAPRMGHGRHAPRRPPRPGLVRNRAHQGHNQSGHSQTRPRPKGQSPAGLHRTGQCTATQTPATPRQATCLITKHETPQPQAAREYSQSPGCAEQARGFSPPTPSAAYSESSPVPPDRQATAQPPPCRTA